jgi:hypothetical protein
MMILDAFLLSFIQALANSPLFVGESFFNGVAGALGGVVLLVIGVLIIILIVAAAIVILPAILIAFLVWLFTGSFFFAGVAFLVVALISIVAVADD